MIEPHTPWTQLTLPFPEPEKKPGGPKPLPLRDRLAIVQRMENIRASIAQQARELDRLAKILRSHV